MKLTASNKARFASPKANSTTRLAAKPAVKPVSAKKPAVVKKERDTVLSPKDLIVAGVPEPFAIRAVDGYKAGPPLRHATLVRGKYGICVLPKGCAVHPPENKVLEFRPSGTFEFLDGLRCKAMFVKELAAGESSVYGVRLNPDADSKFGGYEPCEKNAGARGNRWQRKTWGCKTVLEEKVIDKMIR